MSEEKQSIHGIWSSRWTFVLAATGSAVGLGNIWKFPYIAGENGGGAFVLVYLLCIALIGIPIMMGEILLGRRGRKSPINAMQDMARDSGAGSYWSVIGYMGVLAGIFILSFYSVIAGWAVSYFFKMVSGTFVGADADTVGGIFDGLLADPVTLTFWHTVFMALTIFVIAKGVNAGLERAIRILMPVLFVLLIVLLGYSVSSGGFDKGLSFLFSFDLNKALQPEAFIVALGHSFFTLSLGMGAIMAYGAYMQKKASIGNTVVTIAILDTLVALIAGLVIFPIVFSNNLDPGAGPGLMFVTLPLAFGQMPAGEIFGALFFLLVTFAAWSSAISLAEPGVAWWVESKGGSRVKSAIAIGVICWVMGLGTVLSFNHWAEVKLFGRTFFDNLDFLASNIMLPLGGLLIAIFVGWFMKQEAVREELTMEAGGLWSFYQIIIRFIAPILVLAVFAKALGLIEF